MATKNVRIINSTDTWKHGYGHLAWSISNRNPDTLVVLVGPGPFIRGRIETGQCSHCAEEGHPERVPDIWFWETHQNEQSEASDDAVSGWVGLCNLHAEERHGVSMGNMPNRRSDATPRISAAGPSWDAPGQESDESLTDAPQGTPPPLDEQGS